MFAQFADGNHRTHLLLADELQLPGAPFKVNRPFQTPSSQAGQGTGDVLIGHFACQLQATFGLGSHTLGLCHGAYSLVGRYSKREGL
jgi:hypothetical protein